ncbi:MAG: zinc ribbon domain-containing protein [Sphingomonadaceae bacterium]
MTAEMTLAVMLVSAVGVATFVAWPLLTGRPSQEVHGSEGSEESVLEELLLQKEATYTAMKELEFDHAMGNLSKRDYQELASRYEDKAIALLKIIDGVVEPEGRSGLLDTLPPAVAGVQIGRPRSGRLEDVIEQEVASLRRNAPRKSGRATSREEDLIEREVASLRQHRRAGVVPNGGPGAPGQKAAAPSSPIGTACPSCSSPLRNPAAAFCSSCGASLQTRCSVCGEPAEAGDRFCSACGKPLADRGRTTSEETAVGGANA